MPRIWKQFIAPGTYWINGRPVPFSRERIEHFCREGKAMLAEQLPLRVPEEHQDWAFPYDEDWMKAKDVRFNKGFITDFLQDDDGTGWTELDIPDPAMAKRLETEIKFVSPRIIKEFTDCTGKQWKDVVGHMALTAQPVWHKQLPFGATPKRLGGGATLTAAEISGDFSQAVDAAEAISMSFAGDAPTDLEYGDAKHIDMSLADRVVPLGGGWWESDPPDWIDMAAHHAPKGGVTIAGKFFHGGRFIPNAELAKASPEVKEAVEGKTAERQDKLRKTSPDLAKLQEQVKGHRGELAAADVASAKRVYAGIKAFHGDLALHRIHELIHQDEAKLKKVKGDGPAKDRLTRRMRAYGQMLDWAKGDQDKQDKAAEKALKDVGKASESKDAAVVATTAIADDVPDEVAKADPDKPVKDKSGVIWAKAKAGGEVSPVNGQHYKGGQWMPIHGLSPKQEKHETKPPQGGDMPKPPDKDAGKNREARQPRAPMSPDDVEAEKTQRDRQQKWDEMNAGGGVLSKFTWLGERPNRKPLEGRTNLKQWKEFAEGLGEDKLKAIVDTLKPAYEKAIDVEVAKETAAGKAPPADGVQWAKDAPTRNVNDAIQLFGKTVSKHARELPSSLLAKAYVEHAMEKAHDVEGLHSLDRTLAGIVQGKPSAGKKDEAEATPPSKSEQKAVDDVAKQAAVSAPASKPETMPSAERVTSISPEQARRAALTSTPQDQAAFLKKRMGADIATRPEGETASSADVQATEAKATELAKAALPAHPTQAEKDAFIAEQDRKRQQARAASKRGPSFTGTKKFQDVMTRRDAAIQSEARGTPMLARVAEAIAAHSKYGDNSTEDGKKYAAALAHPEKNKQYLSIVRAEMIGKLKDELSRKTDSKLAQAALDSLAAGEHGRFSLDELRDIVKAGGLAKWAPTDRPEWQAQEKKTAEAQAKKEQLRTVESRAMAHQQRERWKADTQKRPAKERLAEIAARDTETTPGGRTVKRPMTFLGRALNGVIAELWRTTPLEDQRGYEETAAKAALDDKEKKSVRSFRQKALRHAAGMSDKDLTPVLAALHDQGYGAMTPDEFRHAAKQALLAVSRRESQDFSQSNSDGRWITIGGKVGEDGERHGGSPVFIKDGKITKGHPSLTGKNVGALKEPAPDNRPAEPGAGATKEQLKEHKAKVAGINRAELNQSKQHARAVWAKKARKEGIPTESLHSLADEMLAHDKAFKDDKLALLQRARKLSKDLGHQDISNLGTLAGRGMDSDKVRGLDDVAARLQEEQPEFFAGGSLSPAERLFDMLTEGNPATLTEDEAYEQAFNHLAEERDKYRVKDGETIPFSLFDVFKEAEHPRDQTGQFTAKDTAVVKRWLKSGKIAPKKAEAGEEITSAISGKKIKKYVELPGGHRVHPDELHRLKTEGDRAVLDPHEKLTVLDQFGKNPGKTFHQVLSDVSKFPERPNDQITIASAHGYTHTKPRHEWAEVAKSVKPETAYSEWLDEHEGDVPATPPPKATTEPKELVSGTGFFKDTRVGARPRLFDMSRSGISPGSVHHLNRRLAQIEQAFVDMGWTAETSSEGHLKAVGYGPHQGRVEYGKRASELLQQQNEEAEYADHMNAHGQPIPDGIPDSQQGQGGQRADSARTASGQADPDAWMDDLPRHAAERDALEVPDLSGDAASSWEDAVDSAMRQDEQDEFQGQHGDYGHLQSTGAGDTGQINKPTKPMGDVSPVADRLKRLAGAVRSGKPMDARLKKQVEAVCKVAALQLASVGKAAIATPGTKLAPHVAKLPEGLQHTVIGMYKAYGATFKAGQDVGRAVAQGGGEGAQRHAGALGRVAAVSDILNGHAKAEGGLGSAGPFAPVGALTRLAYGGSVKAVQAAHKIVAGMMPTKKWKQVTSGDAVDRRMLDMPSAVLRGIHQNDRGSIEVGEDTYQWQLNDAGELVVNKHNTISKTHKGTAHFERGWGFRGTTDMSVSLDMSVGQKSQDAMHALLKAFQDAEDPSWLETVIMAAMDRGRNLYGAIKLANAALEQYPTGPNDEQGLS